MNVASAARWAFSAALALSSATAHEFTITPVTVVITGDGAFQADVGLDADALALGLPLEADSELVARGMRELSQEAFAGAVEKARIAVQDDLRIAVDEVAVPFDVAFPHHGTPAATEADPPTVLGTLARLTGRVPEHGSALVFRAPARYKTVSLQILAPNRPEAYSVLLEPAEPSPAFPLAEGSETVSEQGVFLAYLKLGFTHIVPKGLDHILFVLGLFLLSARWRPLLYQVTAFTLAHFRDARALHARHPDASREVRRDADRAFDQLGRRREHRHFEVEAVACGAGLLFRPAARPRVCRRAQ